MQIWHLKQGMERRFQSGHPWVYSNELLPSSHPLEPGEIVELQDARGNFLARGYGNPHSLIRFRALSRNPLIQDPSQEENLLSTLVQAQALRNAFGFKTSYRLCHGEGDCLPGLIVDRYLVSAQTQVFVVQAHTAGAEKISKNLVEVLKKLVKDPKKWDQTGILLKNNVNVRKLEGLNPEPCQTLKTLEGVDFRSLSIQIDALEPGEKSMIFHGNLWEGQKTGFFLDQRFNIQLTQQKLTPWFSQRNKLRILDLASYIGQWSVQLGTHFQNMGKKCEVFFLDSSQDALHFAQQNANAHSLQATCLNMDLQKIHELSPKSFDLIIVDPPAFIKHKKSIPTGKHAYLQLYTQALRLLKPQGAIIACTCSGLFCESDFTQTLAKATLRSQTKIHWIARGFPSSDHPVLLEFPEGHYLKSWIGVQS
jgi:23S rRNA (cytosine1962-C5)-methyltransferase